MARPQTYNHNQVLESAMQLFWRKGYVSTSVKDLTKATNLQPGSLYGAFSSKRSLFIDSIEYYFDQLHHEISNILNSNGQPLQKIRQLFEYLIKRITSNNDKSCLLLNTLIEVPAEDDEIRQKVARMLHTIEQQFNELLIEAQRNGELACGLKPESAAMMLMSGIFGIQVYNRMQPDEVVLRQIVNNLLSSLEKTG